MLIFEKLYNSQRLGNRIPQVEFEFPFASSHSLSHKYTWGMYGSISFSSSYKLNSKVDWARLPYEDNQFTRITTLNLKPAWRVVNTTRLCCSEHKTTAMIAVHVASLRSWWVDLWCHFKTLAIMAFDVTFDSLGYLIFPACTSILIRKLIRQFTHCFRLIFLPSLSPDSVTFFKSPFLSLVKWIFQMLCIRSLWFLFSLTLGCCSQFPYLISLTFSC